MVKSLFVAILAILIVVVSLSFHEKNTAQAGGGGEVATQRVNIHTWTDVAMAPLGDNLVSMYAYFGSRWYILSPRDRLSPLWEVENGRGYWVNVKRAQVVSLCGTTYSFEPGWNLIGWVKACY